MADPKKSKTARPTGGKLSERIRLLRKALSVRDEMLSQYRDDYYTVLSKLRAQETLNGTLNSQINQYATTVKQLVEQKERDHQTVATLVNLLDQASR